MNKLRCPQCGLSHVKRNGLTHYGKQNYRRQDCDRQFVEDSQHICRYGKTLAFRDYDRARARKEIFHRESHNVGFAQMIRDALDVRRNEVSRQKIAIANARGTGALNPLESEISSFVCHR